MPRLPLLLIVACCLALVGCERKLEGFQRVLPTITPMPMPMPQTAPMGGAANGAATAPAAAPPAAAIVATSTTADGWSDSFGVETYRTPLYGTKPPPRKDDVDNYIKPPLRR